ncbi:hydantoinase/oxoprolinase family protein [Natronorarus salvus]|uniref:hydantoinase/oxoprolinase family protein n=1 Tax=Natronorarus salvus TaxID=3117733 RepID=UPI002F26B4BD
MQMILVGVDIGGTFTDIYKINNQTGEQEIHKLNTTPEDPSKGALEGIKEICELTDTDPTDIKYVLHGTTIATNAVLEHEGVETGMITTENYRDVIHIGRHQRPQNYSIQQDIPWQAAPLVKRRHRKTVLERIIPPDGDIEIPLDEDAVIQKANGFREENIKSIAICFLFSYLNEEHENRAKELVEEVYPEAYVTTSCEVYPQFREFERFTTTAMNAYIGPTVIEYLNQFKSGLQNVGIDAELHIMQSNGGIGTESTVAQTPVNLLYSGPAGGILGAKWRSGANTAEAEDINVITIDMGGTSADIGIVAGGEISEANVRETEIGGYPIMTPMIDISTIGAGGGSIAYLDQGGAFRVGPKSAGADPGPIAYNFGGTEPTVTDAHVALGRIREEFFLGGDMTLNLEGARKGIKQEIADPLGLDTVEASLGVLNIVNNNMANAIRSKTIQKGRDPQKFTLVGFGGAGPMHTADLARELGVAKCLIPISPGVLSATGLTTTDIQYDYISTEFSLISEAEHDDITAKYDKLIDQATSQITADGIPESDTLLEMTADCRYEGQGYELNIRVGQNGRLDDLETIRNRFDKYHESEFGHNFPHNPVEIVNERVAAVGRIPSSELVEVEQATGPVVDEVITTEEVHFRLDQEIVGYETDFYDRNTLMAGHEIQGPAIIGEKDSTTIVPPDFTATVLDYGDLELVQTE